MSKLVDRLHHKEHAALTEDGVVAGWAASPSGSCDICNSDIDGVSSRRVPAAQFATVVRQGYNPLASGRAADAVSLGTKFGMSSDESYRGWRDMALRDMEDWALCEACAKDVAGFITRH